MTASVTLFQPGILAPPPAASRHLFFRLTPQAEPRPALARLAARADGEETVIGIGASVAERLERAVDGLHELSPLVGPGVAVPSTPVALWCWLRGSDPGTLLHRGRALTRELREAFELDDAVSTFLYEGGRDLTGYEDGTENPTGDRAVEVAFAAERGTGLDGSSYVAVQRWVHSLDRFAAMEPGEQDATIGRRRSDNEEMDDAPDSAHVKRAAMESFDPEAFMLRRSMPWADDRGEGLVFVAFGASLDPFEAVLRRMVGLEDGVTDALFRFTRPVTGCALWCPPLRDGVLDLSALGL